jgi:methyl coenzyme M reductase alpha subunit
LIPEKRVCELIDEIRRNGVTGSDEISGILERAHGIEVPPHIVAEYRYRERKRRFLAGAE